MKAGSLVRIKRMSVGVPKGSLGIIVDDYSGVYRDFPVYDVYMCGTPSHPRNKTRRYLEVDLEVIK